MEIEGMIIRDLGPTEGTSKAGNPWRKHEWVLETNSQYPRKVKFTVFGDRTNTITFELGKSYAIAVDIESREYNERWYTDVMAYQARPLEAGMPGQQGPQANPYQAPSAPAFAQPAAQPGMGGGERNPFAPVDGSSSENSEEDLPF